MPRTPARVTQADVARAIRAAQQAGAGAVEVLPDGTIRILVVPPAVTPPQAAKAEPQVDDGPLPVL